MRKPTEFVRSLDSPDELVELPLLRFETVDMGDLSVGWTVLEPGWKWSEVVRPVVGEDWCQSRHVGVLLSGHFRAVMEDGTQVDVGPRDVYVIPPGHDGMVIGDEPAVSIEWSGVRGWIPTLERQTERVLSTILITDIVDSTPTAERLGDARWRTVLAAHNERTRELLGRFRGREVNTTGDGFVAMFDGAGRAVRCALELVAGASSDALPSRAAVHTGELERVGSDIRGLTVHEAARMASLAGAGEVLVSEITRQLAADPTIGYADRGEHGLRGISGARRLFAATISR